MRCDLKAQTVVGYGCDPCCGTMADSVQNQKAREQDHVGTPDPGQMSRASGAQGRGQDDEASPALVLAVSTGAMLYRVDLECEQKSLFLKWEHTGYREGFAVGVQSGHTMGHVTSLHFFFLLRDSQKPRVVRVDGPW